MDPRSDVQHDAAVIRGRKLAVGERGRPHDRVSAGNGRTGKHHIWVTPITGGNPRQLTNFTDRRVSGFAWSPDGKRLAIGRVLRTSDVVMLKGLD